MNNTSFDGSPVHFRMDLPILLVFDPVCLDGIHDLLASWPANSPIELTQLIERLNVRHSAVGCYEISDFQPGMYELDPRDIHKFGDDEDDLDFDDAREDESGAADDEVVLPLVAVDSGALIIVDFCHLAEVMAVLDWEKYDLGLQDETNFDRISEKLGGPFFALIQGGGSPDMDFDGDGMYTLEAGSVRPVRG